MLISPPQKNLDVDNWDKIENITDNSSNSTNLKVFVKDLTNENITLVSGDETDNAYVNQISPDGQYVSYQVNGDPKIVNLNDIIYLLPYF